MPGAPTVTFRLPPIGMIGVVALAVGTTPVAFAAPGLQALYLLPAGLGLWLLRIRTVAGPDAVCARTLLRTRRLRWDDVVGLRLSEGSWVRAVLRSGREVTLPAVRTRDVPVLAAASNGRISDPTAAGPSRDQR